MKKRKICIVTGTRAEYGLLRWLMDGINKSTKLELQIIATGMHLSEDFGLTFKEIEKDGFHIDCKVNILGNHNSSYSISESTSLGIKGFSTSLEKIKPDIVILLGDRFEMLSAAIAATFAKIPIAHIHGGETTEGAFDESIRHSITKMSWWHFVAAEDYARRVIQLGESPQRVFNVGSLGIEAINKTKLLSRKKLIEKMGIQFKEKNLMVTFHPVTLEQKTSKNNFKSILDSLIINKDIYIIFTMPNADPDSAIIKEMIDDFVFHQKDRSIAFTSMGHLNYLSTLQFVDGVLGNSSSGIIEAPIFKIGTINIGDRQKGRLRSSSIIDCRPDVKLINQSINKLYSKDFKKTLIQSKNVYGSGNSSKNIIDILKIDKIPKELKKNFYDL